MDKLKGIDREKTAVEMDRNFERGLYKNKCFYPRRLALDIKRVDSTGKL